MALYDVFHKAAVTVFRVFKSLIHKGKYVIVTRDGWGNESVVERDVDVIIDNFTLPDIQTLPFGNKIQPTDVKGLIRGAQLLDIAIKVDHEIRLGTGRNMTIINFTTDPASALYIFQLRD